jgi:hypothetical protein
MPFVGWVLEWIVHPVLRDECHRTIPPLFNSDTSRALTLTWLYSRQVVMAWQWSALGLVMDHYSKLASLSD